MPETNTKESTLGEDSQPVLAYRVGQAEKSIREGFQKLNDKLDVMVCTFATHKDIESMQATAESAHKAIYVEIEETRVAIKEVKRQKNVQNVLSTILGIVLTLLVTFAIQSALK